VKCNATKHRWHYSPPSSMVNPTHLSIPGPGPYGFRLTGGDGAPLAVAKLRAKSKANELGLQEGDLVLGINGRSCQSISHSDAVRLLTSSDQQLDLYIARTYCVS